MVVVLERSQDRFAEEQVGKDAAWGKIWSGYFLLVEEGLLPAKMTSIVEHQRAKGCFLEKGREPGEDDNVLLDLKDHDNDTVGKVIPDCQAAESGVSQVEVGVHLQLGHLRGVVCKGWYMSV